jgi:CubicO group peptidase (beta-lactamase class C family)
MKSGHPERHHWRLELHLKALWRCLVSGTSSGYGKGGARAFSSRRLARVRDLLERLVDSGFAPGAVFAVARRGDVHITAAGYLALEGEGSTMPMASDTIFRIASMSKPLVAACAMTLVEDCTLRLDDPVDEFLPELANMTVLSDPNGPLDDTVPARRPITVRDLLTFRLGTGMVIAEPGTVPICDALDALRLVQQGPDAAGRTSGSAA